MKSPIAPVSRSQARRLRAQGAPLATFTVVFRTGGTENCVWKRTLPFATKKEAMEAKESTERMGFKALVHQTDHLDKIGMPEGWEA